MFRAHQQTHVKAAAMPGENGKNVKDHSTILEGKGLTFRVKKLKWKVLEQCSISLKSKSSVSNSEREK